MLVIEPEYGIIEYPSPEEEASISLPAPSSGVLSIWKWVFERIQCEIQRFWLKSSSSLYRFSYKNNSVSESSFF